MRNLTLAGFATGSLIALAAFADKRPYAGNQVIAFPTRLIVLVITLLFFNEKCK
jgi:hypothetical protein